MNKSYFLCECFFLHKIGFTPDMSDASRSPSNYAMAPRQLLKCQHINFYRLKKNLPKYAISRLYPVLCLILPIERQAPLIQSISDNYTLPWSPIMSSNANILLRPSLCFLFPLAEEAQPVFLPCTFQKWGPYLAKCFTW